MDNKQEILTKILIQGFQNSFKKQGESLQWEVIGNCAGDVFVSGAGNLTRSNFDNNNLKTF